MDGTPPGYYVQIGAEATKFVLLLEGGGECTDQDSCDYRLNSSLSSSDYFVPSRTLDDPDYYFLVDANAERNPDLANWTRVYVPYCS